MTINATPPRRGGRITHTGPCPRTAPVLEAIRTTPAGEPLEVQVCSECDSTDMTERLLDAARAARAHNPEGPTAA